MADKTICFLTAGDYAWASARLRSFWPAQYIPGAAAAQWKPNGDIPPGYRMYVWQKNTDPAGMKLVRMAEAYNVIDHCDPVWWWDPARSYKAHDLADAIVCATEGAARDYADFAGMSEPVVIIPDRLQLPAYPYKRPPHKHADPVRFVWFGMEQNRIALLNCLANLERLTANGVNMQLTIIDNGPEHVLNWTEMFPVYHTRWTLETENRLIAAHDIALVPPYPGPWGALKSNNRTLVAWACGLPVITGTEYRPLFDLATRAELRQTSADKGWHELTTLYDVKQSAEDWRDLYTRLTGEAL